MRLFSASTILLSQIDAEDSRLEARNSTMRSPQWARSAKIALCWIVIGTLEGGVIAAFDQEFGSVGFLAMGFVVGLSGAMTHTAAIQSYSFDNLPYLIQLSILSMGAVLLPAAFLVTAAIREPAPHGHPFWELSVISEAIIPMAVIASPVLCWLGLRIGRPTDAKI